MDVNGFVDVNTGMIVTMYTCGYVYVGGDVDASVCADIDAHMDMCVYVDAYVVCMCIWMLM